MEKRAVENLLARVISVALVVGVIIISPGLSLDPIGPPKLAILVICASLGIGAIIANRRRWDFSEFRTLVILLSLFCIWQIVVVFASGGNKLQQVFGINGRYTGLLTYFSLSALLLTTALVSTALRVKMVANCLLLTGGLSVFYGLIQVLSLDPLPWANVYSPVSGFLGNPDFQSAFVGIVSIIAFSLLMGRTNDLNSKIQLILFISVGLLVIKQSDSQQGFIVLAIGASIVTFLNIKYRFHTNHLFVFSSLLSVSFLTVFLGAMNIGPFAQWLSRGAFITRIDYWQAGWKMTISHPLFGVGLDSYVDWYRRSRSLAATVRFGPAVFSNAAHNVYLDLSSGGGFPLLIIYSALTSLVVISCWRILKRSTSLDPYFVGIVAAWFGYQAQSLISLNQIGLAITGWVLSGTIIGYEINTRSNPKLEVKSKAMKKVSGFSGSTWIALLASVAIGFSAGIPPLVASTKFKDATESDQLSVAINAAYLFPLDIDRMVVVATNLHDNKYDAEALTILTDAVNHFPDSFEAWSTLATLSNLSPAQVANAKAQMKRLDPLNPTLK